MRRMRRVSGVVVSVCTLAGPAAASQQIESPRTSSPAVERVATNASSADRERGSSADQNRGAPAGEGSQAVMGVSEPKPRCCNSE